MTETKKREKKENLNSFLKNEALYIEHDYNLEVIKKSDYHYRIYNHKNGKYIDVYPSTKKVIVGNISKNVIIYTDLDLMIKHHLL